MALNLNAELVILHVVQTPFPYDVPLTQYEYETMLQDAEQELELLKKDLEIRTGGEIAISIKAVLSTLENEIVDLAEEKKPFIIVLGPERESFAERFFMGSNTFSVIKNLHYPVIVVPKNAIFRHIRRIGLATDLNDVNEISVEAIRMLVEVFNANLDIIHVCKNAEDGTIAKACLTALREKLQEFDPEVHIILNEHVEKALEDYSRLNHEDMLVVIPRERSITNSLLHKSHTKQMAMHPAVPLLAIS